MQQFFPNFSVRRPCSFTARKGPAGETPGETPALPGAITWSRIAKTLDSPLCRVATQRVKALGQRKTNRACGRITGSGYMGLEIGLRISSETLLEGSSRAVPLASTT